MKKKLLKKIVNIAIKTDDINKLRYIGQSLDVMLFYPKYKKDYDYLYKIFRKIDSYLNEKKEYLLGPLNNRNYPDLTAIGLIECVTFSNIEDNPVPPLDNLLEEYIDRNFWQDGEVDYSVEDYHNFLKSKLQSGVETE